MVESEQRIKEWLLSGIWWITNKNQITKLHTAM